MSHRRPIDIPPGGDSRENGGASIALHELAESLGVVRHLTETYSVGGFRYIRVTDAIVQARRMAKIKQARS
jgi:hypothetical protein